ncbi:MAG: hypothetical protein Q4P17_10490, partial [Methanobacterium sp.]|nr:hypothetical protein [Methanobacterium sp.]
ILLGSTQKCGVGTNIQDRMVALHNLDCPYRPADLSQREGRILRQGNLNKEVNIYRYVTKDTFDSYLWQLVENKQKFISQIMTSKITTRNCEDIDETVLNFSEVKALATGNPLIKEKMDIDNDISRLRLLKSNFDTQKYSLEDKVNFIFPKQLKENKLKLSLIENDIVTRNKNKTNNEFYMTIRGRKLDKREDAGAIIMTLGEKNIFGEIGYLQGFKVSLEKDKYQKYLVIGNESGYKHKVELSESPIGNVRKLENVLGNLENKRDKYQIKVEEIERNSVQAKEQLKRPFPYSEELKIKELRQMELDQLLSVEITTIDKIKEVKPEIDEIIKEAENSMKKSKVEKLNKENVR